MIGRRFRHGRPDSGSAKCGSRPIGADDPLEVEPKWLFNQRVQQQQTLRESVRTSGTGLHGGNRVNMAFLPAPPNTGIRFRRVDLEGKPEIEARIDSVVDTSRSTTLGKGAVRVHTVEHVLAAFNGLGIDNAIIELDAAEPPIADGSAQEFGRLIASAGSVMQGTPREPVVIQRPIEFQAGESFLSVFPHDRFRISCTSSDKQGHFTQFATVEIEAESWQREVAPARTFCFYDEIEFLIRKGLIKGGSLENAVVIRDDAILTTEPLRFQDEFVRHKVLDLVGDLSLLGRRIQGHVVAIRPSHAANCEFVRQIRSQAVELQTPSLAFTAPPKPRPDGTPVVDGATLDIDQVMAVLPHRYPFLMVDKVTRIQGNRITAIKNVTANEVHFQGHFPSHPVMPGVLQLEAMAQVAGILMLKQPENAGKLAYFMSADSVKWRTPVRPGDVLEIDVELTRSRGKIGRAQGKCLVAGQVVSEAEVTFMLLDA